MDLLVSGRVQAGDLASAAVFVVSGKLVADSKCSVWLVGGSLQKARFHVWQAWSGRDPCRRQVLIRKVRCVARIKAR